MITMKEANQGGVGECCQRQWDLFLGLPPPNFDSKKVI